MREWHRGINMDDWEKSNIQRCTGDRNGFRQLLAYCKDKGDVYHMGFVVFVETGTGEPEEPRRRTGRNATRAAEGTDTQSR
jgi:hypothetical protein